jgi:hypothetical protein
MKRPRGYSYFEKVDFTGKRVCVCVCIFNACGPDVFILSLGTRVAVVRCDADAFEPFLRRFSCFWAGLLLYIYFAHNSN